MKKNKLKSMREYAEMNKKYKADNKLAASDFFPAVVAYFASYVLGLVSLHYLGIFHYTTIIMMVLCIAFTGKLFVIQHDCGHGSYFETKKQNNIVGTMLSFVTYIPYKAWKITHSFHHRMAEILELTSIGSIKTLTVDEFRSLSISKKIIHMMFRNVFVLLVFGGVYYLFVLARFSMIKKTDLHILGESVAAREWKRFKEAKADKRKTNIILIIINLIGWYFFGVEFLLFQFVILSIYMAFAIWFFYVQHQFEEAHKVKTRNDWDHASVALLGSSYYVLPALVNYFTGNIGYHHIHHLFLTVPSYKLKKAHDDYKEHYESIVYMVNFRKSLSLAWCSLFDYQEKKMISFSEFFRREKARI